MTPESPHFVLDAHGKHGALPVFDQLSPALHAV